jgi:hypothetical protein
MSKLFEEWLVELAKNENYSVLDRLPEYLNSEYDRVRDRSAERDRLIAYFRNNAPKTPFSTLILEVIADTK